MLRPSEDPMLLRVTVTALAAASLSLLTSPFNWAWLHWVALVPMFWALREGEPRSNRWLAFLYGTLGVALLFRWLGGTIMTFSNLGWPIAALAVLLFAIVFGSPYLLLWGSVHPLRRRLGSLWIVALPALQVVIEYATMYVFLFPYNHGATQYRTPWMWQIVSITGVAGLSYALFFVNASLAEVLYRRREGKAPPWPWLAASALLVVGVLGFGAWRHAAVEATLAAAPTLRVGIVQTDKTMVQRFTESRRRMILDWIEATERLSAANDDVDLVVWSEGASPANVHDGAVYTRLAGLAREGGFELFVGGGTDEPHAYPETEAEWAAERARDPALRELRGREPGDQWWERYNSVYLFGRDGQIRGRYDKLVPLPFGEYLPLSDTFPILREWIKGPGDFRAGKEATVIEGETARIAAPICYEAILPYQVRRFDDPDLLVNPTNDAWFARPGPEQHAMLAVGRATELGIPLVRSAYTGVSMVVEPHGDIVHEVPVLQASEAVVPVRMARVPTVYARLGDWFTAACAVLLAASLALGPWLRRRLALREVPPAPK